MNRILLVEDSASSQTVVRSALAGLDVELKCCATLAEAEDCLIKSNPFNLILLDRLLPDGDGLSLLSRPVVGDSIRQTPVLLLTGNEDMDSKVSAFALGAEDYIVKPVDPRELKARVEARLRKGRTDLSNDILQLGCLKLNFPLMRATLKEKEGQETPVELTAKEFRLLAMLTTHEGQVFSRSQLVKEIWGGDMNVVNRTVDSHICGARRKLGPAGDYIESITGEGYRFRVKS